MTTLHAAVTWALLATLTAFLPMRWQMVPGMFLLVTAPILVIWIGLANGRLWAVLAVLAFLSMFRRPLTYLARRLVGAPAERPDPAERRK